MSPVHLTRLALLAAALALGACATPPTHFYTLLAPPAERQAQRPDFALEVLPVDIPGQVDQPQFVIRRSDGELALAEQHLWIAPLADEYRAGLSARLVERLGAPDVYRVPRARTLPLYRVRTRVLRFESVLSGEARQQVLWSIEPPGDDANTLTCAGAIGEAAPGGYLDLTRAHQRALSRIASDIAGTIAALSLGQSPACP